MRTITILHPFSAKSVGLESTDLYYFHSKPHENALRILQSKGFGVTIDYFTGSFFPYTKTIKGVKKRFWPVSCPILKKRHAWKKQHSLFNYLYTSVKPSTLTIINMSGHGSAYCFKLAALLKKQNKPYIAMIGGMHMGTSKDVLSYYNNANHIIVHTQVQKDILKQTNGFKDLEIKVMPLGVDTSLFKPYFEVKEKSSLLYVGRISRLKQIECAIDSLSYLNKKGVRGVNLTIIGPISDTEYHKELQEKVRSLGLESQIHFKGALNQEDLIPYYQKATLLLMPSKHESFGMVMVEAMGCGTPVVAFRGSGGPDEIVTNNVTGLLCEDVNYSEEVYNLLINKKVLDDMCLSAVLDVKHHWSLDYTAKCLESSVKFALEKF
ncbi:glycosyltransferase family 4 protein [Winogradskyella vidalii]|uniref:glycosyltransferase family 4 protein n=1 Tax=Winogradskyella vidalii TaxID=2615024 RepID=UPI0015C9F1BA|nr:glycosyltransferase family 4 protein [Winogradskyella vidalii]